MSNWRPEGWDTNRFGLRVAQGRKLEPHERDNALTSLKLARESYEAGADAMLEAISEEIEKSLLTDEEIKEAEEKWIAGALPEQMISLGRGHYEDITPIIAQAQLQKILALLK